MTGDEMDDLDKLTARMEAANPAIRMGREDLQSLDEVIDGLLARRKELGLSQREVARRMKVKQPTVSEFETETSDPKVSTVQRYARAVGLRFEAHLTFLPTAPPTT